MFCVHVFPFIPWQISWLLFFIFVQTQPNLRPEGLGHKHTLTLWQDQNTPQHVRLLPSHFKQRSNTAKPHKTHARQVLNICYIPQIHFTYRSSQISFCPLLGLHSSVGVRDTIRGFRVTLICSVVQFTCVMFISPVGCDWKFLLSYFLALFSPCLAQLLEKEKFLWHVEPLHNNIVLIYFESL